MRHKVPHFRQPNDYTCMAACLKMMLDYREKAIPFDKIVTGIRTTKKHGADLVRASLYLAKLGMGPTLFYFDPDKIPSWYQGVSQTEWQKNLQRRTAQGWPWRQLSKLIAGGGIFYPQHLSMDGLRRILRRQPIIVLIESSYLDTQKGAPVKRMQHAILLVDQDRSGVHFLNPQAEEIQRIRWDIFEIAYFSCGGEALYF